MPKRRTQEILYRRGRYWLAWDEKADGTRRSPYPAIFWYDEEAQRIRSNSTGTTDVEEAKGTLDSRYVKETFGESVCPTCRQPIRRSGLPVADAIANYLTLVGNERDSADAIRPRLEHVLNYLETLPGEAVCEDVDENWIERFRRWNIAQPIVSISRKRNEAGQIVEVRKERPRAPGTVEASVRMLAAAVNLALDPTGKTKPASFSAKKPKEVSRTPNLRVQLPMLASMFRYATDPAWRGPRDNLHRYLIGALISLGRPDAIYDISVDQDRGQWSPDFRVLALNPRNRAQTSKYRATVKVPSHGARVLDELVTRAGRARSKAERRRLSWLVPVGDIGTAWDRMCGQLGLPIGQGEAGQKLIRRSVGTLLRSRRVGKDDIELALGHRVFDPVTDLYAPFDPLYLEQASEALEAICAEIEALVPNAFTLHLHRSDTGDADNVVSLQEARRA